MGICLGISITAVSLYIWKFPIHLTPSDIGRIVLSLWSMGGLVYLIYVIFSNGDTFYTIQSIVGILTRWAWWVRCKE